MVGVVNGAEEETRSIILHTDLIMYFYVSHGLGI